MCTKVLLDCYCKKCRIFITQRIVWRDFCSRWNYALEFCQRKRYIETEERDYEETCEYCKHK